jgi:hypothetical protein
MPVPPVNKIVAIAQSSGLTNYVSKPFLLGKICVMFLKISFTLDVRLL